MFFRIGEARKKAMMATSTTITARRNLTASGREP